jgi:predicted permease
MVSNPSDLSRRWRRLLVRIRISPFTVPLALLLFWGIVVWGLSRVADSWIVALAAMPLAFAALLTLLCWWAYRRDFYA